MPKQHDLEIQFVGQRSKDIKSATLEYIQYSAKEQKIRAVKTLLMFWLISMVTILIPIAHFFLVPGFFIVGIYMASKLWKVEKEGQTAKGDCPACQNSICLDLEKKMELPQWHNCPECAESLQLQSKYSES